MPLGEPLLPPLLPQLQRDRRNGRLQSGNWLVDDGGTNANTQLRSCRCCGPGESNRDNHAGGKPDKLANASSAKLRMADLQFPIILDAGDSSRICKELTGTLCSAGCPSFRASSGRVVPWLLSRSAKQRSTPSPGERKLRKILINGGEQRGYWASGAYPRNRPDTIIVSILP